MARTIVGAVRQVDTVARLAGDEFTVLCENVDSEEAALQIVTKLQHAFEPPLDIDGENGVQGWREQQASPTTTAGVRQASAARWPDANGRRRRDRSRMAVTRHGARAQPAEPDGGTP